MRESKPRPAERNPMSIHRLIGDHLTRSISRAMLAAALVLMPAIGGALWPIPAAAQDAVDFRAALEGYGQWVQHPRWGEVWIPEQVPQDWQPYRIGHWVYTDDWGWYWDSEE